jgi:hypothetical protein
LTFQLVDSGKQCHKVTVTADGSEPATAQACVTAIQAAALEVKITGPRSRVVGEIAEFNAGVRNTGSSVAADVQLRIQFDQSIEPIADSGVERLPDGSILVKFDRELAANERRVFRLQGRCRSPSTKACARATVTALGGATSQDEACLEILPAISDGGPAGAGAP